MSPRTITGPHLAEAPFRVPEFFILSATAAMGAAIGGAAGVGRGLGSTLVLTAFFATLAAASRIDIRERRIPNLLTIPGMVLGLLGAAWAGTGTEALSGLLLAGGVMAAAALTARGQLGAGDVKLCAFVGAVLGPSGAVTFLLIGTGAGALAAAVLLTTGRATRNGTLAYGPYLALGGAISAWAFGPVTG